MSVCPTDIIRFEIRLETVPDPMYGESKVLRSEESLASKSPAEIIELAKDLQSKYENTVYVLANQYTSEDNVKRHFALQSHYVWNKWLVDVQVKGAFAYVGIEL